MTNDPRTPLASGSTSRRPLDNDTDLVTVTEEDGSFWQYLETWIGTPPERGVCFWVTDCRWFLLPDGRAMREVHRWELECPAHRWIIDPPTPETTP